MKKHGDRAGNKWPPEYNTWRGMKARCLNKKAKDYPDYGGRGIKVCEEWLDYRGFLAAVGRKPSPSHSLDRLDFNGDYEPENVQWATKLQQTHNRRKKKKREGLF